ncbi:cytochrome b5 [Choiromyces venosus 120613-1]|uniref:Cytochrome b5 n=1 Tax=Choiromyces venosus 120613-1 TaxID=1336337 RepID=A0A3N4JG76_9PEZI|nr:cytochrome b5 [Choiromyces venosus 120613-1]
MAEDTLRNRKPPPTTLTPGTPANANPTDDDDNDANISKGISTIDVLRVLTGALLLSVVFSWFVTDGESITWGYKPKALRWNNLKNLFKTPLVLTDEQLSQYSGANPELPIYVAVNGSVFDVSASPQTYGPGGSYGFFSGRDASRAFVSGCFKDDLTWDLRGLEEMYITGDLRAEDDKEISEILRLESTGENDSRVRYLKKRRDKRRKEAWQKVEKAISHWENFFKNHEKYFYVGKVVHPDLSETPVRELCKGNKKP